LIFINRGSVSKSLLEKGFKRDEVKTGFSRRNIIQVITPRNIRRIIYSKDFSGRIYIDSERRVMLHTVSTDQDIPYFTDETL
jgi:hypothetical protein